MTEKTCRRIEHKDHNRFVTEGVSPHKATQTAPSTLLSPLNDKIQKLIQTRHNHIIKLLRSSFGEPFFHDKGFYLYNDDCLKLMPKILDSEIAVNLTLTSPPYNIGKEYEQPMSVDEYVKWCSKWMQMIFDITDENGAFWLNVGYLEVPEKGSCVPIPYLLWDKSSFYLIQEVVWKYGAGVSAKRKLSPRNEKWLFYVKNINNYTFNLDDIRDPNVKYPNQKKKGKFRCNPMGKNPSDVWEFPKVTTGKHRSSRERTGHPAQFPLAVVERIIRASSNEVDLVLDPFAGSCTAGVAAAGLGRLFIGFERRTDYCELATKRFKQFNEERDAVNKQPPLF